MKIQVPTNQQKQKTHHNLNLVKEKTKRTKRFLVTIKRKTRKIINSLHKHRHKNKGGQIQKKYLVKKAVQERHLLLTIETIQEILMKQKKVFLEELEEKERELNLKHVVIILVQKEETNLKTRLKELMMMNKKRTQGFGLVFF